jgi:hypothetical protein
MATETLKYTDKPKCGINLFKDKSFAHAKGPFRATEAETRQDKPAVDKDAVDAAEASAKKEAEEVAKRKCPDNCKHKSSPSSPDDPESTIFPGTTYFSGPSVERILDIKVLGVHIKVDVWRWIANASAEWEVSFSCE